MKHILSVKDFTPGWVEEVLEGTEKMIPYVQERKRFPNTKRGGKATIISLEPTTRTAGSNRESARLLGLDIYSIVGAEAIALAKDESLANTIRMFGWRNQGSDVIIMRTKIEGAQRFLAKILAELPYELS